MNAVATLAVAESMQAKEDIISISGGCVCCSLRKDVITALHELRKRAARAGAPHDNVIIETTGLADPGPVAFTFFSHPWVAKRYSLDSVMCAAASIVATCLCRYRRSSLHDPIDSVAAVLMHV